MRTARLQLAALTLVSIALLTTGCAGGSNVPKGVAEGARLLGGGKGFRFTAPTDGKMFIVNRGKVITQRNLAAGELFEALGPATTVPESEHPFAENQYWFFAGK